MLAVIFETEPSDGSRQMNGLIEPGRNVVGRRVPIVRYIGVWHQYGQKAFRAVRYRGKTVTGGHVKMRDRHRFRSVDLEWNV